MAKESKAGTWRLTGISRIHLRIKQKTASRRNPGSSEARNSAGSIKLCGVQSAFRARVVSALKPLIRGSAGLSSKHKVFGGPLKSLPHDTSESGV